MEYEVHTGLINSWNKYRDLVIRTKERDLTEEELLLDYQITKLTQLYKDTQSDATNK